MISCTSLSYRRKEAVTEVENRWIRRKLLLRNGYFVKLIGMKGDSCGNSVTPETTGSGHARGKRPGMENNFNAQQKNAIFLLEKNSIFGLCPIPFFVVAVIRTVHPKIVHPMSCLMFCKLRYRHLMSDYTCQAR